MEVGMKKLLFTTKRPQSLNKLFCQLINNLSSQLTLNEKKIAKFRTLIIKRPTPYTNFFDEMIYYSIAKNNQNTG